MLLLHGVVDQTGLLLIIAVQVLLAVVLADSQVAAELMLFLTTAAVVQVVV